MTCYNTRKSFWQYNIIFILICMIGYSPFWAQNKSLIWEIDGLGQYYPSFLYIGQYLREYFIDCLHGNLRLPLFDLSIGMGDDIIGTLNYYGFGDPLNALAMFATKENGAYIFTGMYFLRLYLSGMCFKKYCSYFDLDDTLSTAGMLCYIFSGYSLIGGARYMQFLSPMIYLPLILLGCEKIFREKKILLFTFSVTYAALCNFYFLYITSLFLIIYCMVRCISIYGIREFSKIFREILICMGSYLLGIMIAAPILFPAIYSFWNSCRNSTDLEGSLMHIGNFLLSKEKWLQYLEGGGVNYTGNYWTGIPLVQYICLIGTMFIYKSRRNRQCRLAVIGGTILWCLPITSIVLSGFGNVYTRWVFLLYFVYAIVFICFADGIIKKELGKRIVLLVVAINICINLVKLYGDTGENWGDEFVAFSDINKYVNMPVNGANSILEDDGVYRIANETYTDINGRPENIAMLNGYNGLNFWFSIINGNVQKMIDQVGTSKRTEWRSYGLNNITIYETLAGVKYYVCQENCVEKTGYECVEEVVLGSGCWKIYRNENALPMVYTYSECITEEFFDQLNELEKAEAAARYIVLENGCINPVDKIEASLVYEPKTVYENTGSSMAISCYAEEDEIYLEIEPDELLGKIGKVMINDNTDLEIGGKRNKRILYNLGKGFANRKLIFSMETGGLTDEEAGEIRKQIKVYAMNTNRYQNVIRERNTLKESNIQINKNKVNISNAQMNAAGWMILAVPYSKHWKCYVDGEETCIYRGNTMYMAIRLTAGNHEIIFSYRNVPFYVGIVSCFTAFCIIVFCHRRSSRNFGREVVAMAK